MKCVLLLLLFCIAFLAKAQDQPKWQGKFEQLEQTLPTPNEYRTGSGAPGPNYWQQKADYDIVVELDDERQGITGSEKITYTNNSPDALKYLWLQVDQNLFDPANSRDKTRNTSIRDSVAAKTIADQLSLYAFDGGYKIKSVKDINGNTLPYIINQTMLRIDLPKPLISNEKISFSLEWSFKINDLNTLRERCGYEFFPDDGNYSYMIAQFFPRMCVYDDVVGWQNKQFLGQGEFTLPFGDYKVSITVPADHIVAATGTLKNPQQVLSPDQNARFEKAKTTFDRPLFIVTQAEAVAKEKIKSKEKKTWQFEATNVRDFAFATSRKFIWDAMAVRINDKTPMAMSFYPKEGNPLWEKESTLAVKNALEVYSKYTLDYPYAHATSIHWAINGGMEYPMISFNYGRPDKNGNFTDTKRWGMIGVIIHEVGHNFFPMIVNSDERQSTWMDEGINSFVQFRTEAERYPAKPKGRGYPPNLITYMKGDKTTHRPLMTNSEQVIEFSPEQYGKASTALTILRETVMGPELFDKSFKEYAQRWAFKHPKPADFFRTMEDASAVDLDWFWRGWFYTTDNVDQSIDQVKWYQVRKQTTGTEKTVKVTGFGSSASGKKYNDFSNGPEPLTVLPTDDRLYGDFLGRVDDKAILSKLENKNLYEVTLSNKGGLVMPVIIEWTYKDGSKEIDRLPAEIWRVNETKVTKVFAKDKEVAGIVIDPLKETTDISADNNTFPKKEAASKFDELKKGN